MFDAREMGEQIAHLRREHRRDYKSSRLSGKPGTFIKHSLRLMGTLRLMGKYSKTYEQYLNLSTNSFSRSACADSSWDAAALSSEVAELDSTTSEI